MYTLLSRYGGKVASLLLCAFLLAGCPNLLNTGEFLSASPNGPSRDGFGNGPFPTTDTDGEAAEDDDAPREVVEPDVIRQFGSTLFILNQHRGLSIVDLDSESLLSQTAAAGYPRDLYVVGDRAYVLVAQYSNVSYEGDAVSVGSVGSRLYVFDVADLASPALLGAFDLEGDLVDSRLVGNVLYAVGARFSYYFPEIDEPGATTGSDVVKQQTSASWVTSVDVSNPADVRIVDQLSFEGYGDIIQATSSALFVSGFDWQADASTITYVDINDPSGTIAVRGSVQVPGRVADRFKMNAWNNVLRVVSNTNWPDRETYVSTVPLADPDNLAVLGQTTIPGAKNETLFATRFDGPTAYVVTYLVVDPLFVLDLSDPANPQVSGELIVPGWSTHIEPRGDRLIALGVDDTNGGRRVSVSLFDVSDPYAPALLDRASFGEDWSWSAAYEDVKAFTVLDDTIIVPFSGWTEQGGYDRLQFISYDTNSLDVRGHVDLRGQAVRSFEYASHYYGVTQEQLAIIDGSNLDAPEVIGSITLAENVTDFLPLDDDEAEGVAVIRSYFNNTILLRAQAPDGSTVSELELDGSYAGQILGGTSSVIVLSTVWSEENVHTVAQVVDYSDPANPVLFDAVRLDLRPAYYWWGGYPYGGPEPAIDRGGAAFDIMPYYYQPEASAVVAGDRLVVQGIRSSTANSENPDTILAVVDLTTGEAAGEVTLDYRYVSGLLAVNGSVVIGSQEDAGQNLIGQRFTRHYASLFNPATLALGDRANVPGTPVAYEGNILTLEDWQYTSGFNVQRQLRTAQWNGGALATLVDSQNLGQSYGQLLASGGFVYASGWNNEFTIAAFTVDDEGDINGLAPLKPGNYGNLLAADGDTVYVHVGGSVLNRHTTPGAWTLLDSTPLPQWPQQVRFGANSAYLPLGYAGLLELER